MKDGEGIFYGLVFIGIILLFAVTKDRWNWKRISKWCAGIVVAPLVVLGLWWVGSSYWESRPQVATEFWGLSPGITKDELIFRKGKPDEEKDGFLVYRKTEEGVFYLIKMKNEKVRAVQAIAFEDRPFALPSIQGISSHSTQSSIESKFGLPDHVSQNKEKTRRLSSYLKYGLFFSLEKGVVIGLGVLDPKEGALIFQD